MYDVTIVSAYTVRAAQLVKPYECVCVVKLDKTDHLFHSVEILRNVHDQPTAYS